MSKLLLATIVFALIVGSAPARRCACQKALDRDLPHGANEDVEYSEKTVKRIRGRVVYSNNGRPVDDAVVELYAITPDDKNLKTQEIIVRRPRRAACVTSNDGSFCFTDFPSGNYLLRAGTRSPNAGMNEVYIKLKLDRRWWTSWFRSGKELTLELTPGT